MRLVSHLYQRLSHWLILSKSVFYQVLRGFLQLKLKHHNKVSHCVIPIHTGGSEYRYGRGREKERRGREVFPLQTFLQFPGSSLPWGIWVLSSGWGRSKWSRTPHLGHIILHNIYGRSRSFQLVTGSLLQLFEEERRKQTCKAGTLCWGLSLCQLLPPLLPHQTPSWHTPLEGLLVLFTDEETKVCTCLSDCLLDIFLCGCLSGHLKLRFAN